MPRPISSLVYSSRANGQDYSWKSRAACLGKSNNPNSPFYEAWYTEAGRMHVRPDGSKVSGAKLTEAALTFCAMCPVQWECASTAITINEPYCVWGAHPDDIEWLVKRSGKQPLVVIEQARSAKVSVQAAIRRLREARYRRA